MITPDDKRDKLRAVILVGIKVGAITDLPRALATILDDGAEPIEMEITEGRAARAFEAAQRDAVISKNAALGKAENEAGSPLARAVVALELLAKIANERAFQLRGSGEPYRTQMTRVLALGEAVGVLKGFGP